MSNRVTFHRSNAGEHIWTVQAANWRIIGRSSESYKNKQDCINNFEELTGRTVCGDGSVENKVYAFSNTHEDYNDEFCWEVVFQK